MIMLSEAVLWRRRADYTVLRQSVRGVHVVSR